jgi:SAM-dependent methyltransferase
LLTGVPTIDYVSGDLDSPLAMLRMDLTSMPFGAAAFDVVLCNHVLEHVLDDRAAMKELLRVLKPGGWAILQVPIKRERTLEDVTVSTPEERLKVFGQRDHVRIYGRDYGERLASAGFGVTVEHYTGEFDPASVNSYGLMPDEDIYLCTKTREF